MMRRHAITCALVLCAAAPAARAAVEECTIHYGFGTVRLVESDRAAGRYGADLRYLYGDWDWRASFGLAVDVIKAERYVEDVAALVRDCVADVRYGRLDFTRHQVTDPGTQTSRPETDAEFYDRAFDDLVEVRRELATTELDYDALVHDPHHAPLVTPAPSPAMDTLRSTLSATVQSVLGHAADRTTGLGWIVVNMDALDSAIARFTSAHTLTRSLITVYLHQFPSLRDLVIDQLITNTSAVVDQYGQFFSPERQAALQALLDRAAAETTDENLDAVVANLTQIADVIQGQVTGVWNAGEPLRRIATKLKLVFGSCDLPAASSPQLLGQYFGDLAVTNHILQEGDNGSLCTP